MYFDGNSLGRPVARHWGARLREFVEAEWGGRLIRGWDGALVRPCRSTLRRRDRPGGASARPRARPTVGDSTTVLLYKLVRAAVDARPGRDEIVIDADNFPTDRYIVEGVAVERGMTVRWSRSTPRRA